jgi:hypothetical protein
VVEVSWVELVGYQHEVVHTGVLNYLLDYGSDAADQTRTRVAAALLDEPVAGVSDARREGRAGGSGTPDLVARIALGDGLEFDFAVETKVDSNWSLDQLEGRGAEKWHLIGTSPLVAADNTSA